MVEAGLIFVWREFLHPRMALGEGNVGSDLPPQGTVAYGLKPLLERQKHLLLALIACFTLIGWSV